jgi:pimeloyl-ACP methyl ester carboxylesterase
VLEGALFTLSVDGAMIATEEIHVGQSEGQLLVFSELHRIAAYPITERRTVALTRALDPLRYDLEVSALGVRSVWSGEVREKVIDCLNNNLAWYAPVLVEGISPAPQVMLEGSPSALPFALLALRYAQPAEGTAATPTLLRALDTLEDLPVSRALTLTVDPDRKGAVIGTLALEGQVEGGLNPRFTLWVRPGSRTLYSVEIPECRVNLWQQAGQPGLGRPGRLVIQRVSQLPEAPKPPAAGEAKRVPVEFTGADKTVRSGTLILPEGSGPFPVIVLHSAGGAVPRWDPGDAFAKRGWAVYCYDKRGLGASKGEYDRGALRALADDAALAAAMLRTRPEVDPRRIVFLGIGEGGQVGALAASLASDYAVAVLASCASVGPLFPDLAEQRILHVLAPFYGWTPAQAEAYRGLSVSRWKKWLADGKPEVALLRRRASVRPLKEWAETDLAVALGSAKVPVLLLHGGKDAWTPVDGARKLQEALAGAGAARVSLRVFDELGTDLGAGTSGAALGPEAEQATFEWLERTLVR